MRIRLLVVIAATAAASACSSGGGGSGGAAAPVIPGATGTSAATTTPPSTAAPTTTATTTAPYRPTTVEGSAAAAASRLLATWGAGDQASAAMVATPAAVASLFSRPAVGLQPRGCSDGQPPVDCIYADRRGATPTLYDLAVAVDPAGHWYVDGVSVETP